ncbi:hypothetical protein NDU88_005828 [Pleurodeles waltl]|uniref:Uncharacterized protein n=1 Tax=Pleurodeles waltl TaxID=8319 RepID=A0AAV7SMR8_PLEWA|nr:hypothetical protein NDU88_005828 [Pleurodeles waltl]
MDSNNWQQENLSSREAVPVSVIPDRRLYDMLNNASSTLAVPVSVIPDRTFLKALRNASNALRSAVPVSEIPDRRERRTIQRNAPLFDEGLLCLSARIPTGENGSNSRESTAARQRRF